MEKRNSKLKKIICLFMFLIVCLIPGISKGYLDDYKSWNEYFSGKDGFSKSAITIGCDIEGSNQTKLVKNNGLYCVARGMSLSSYNKNSYKVKAYIEIKGKDATLYTSSSSSGITSSTGRNAKLAYILGADGYGNFQYGDSSSSYTTRQKALYYYWNIWANNVEFNGSTRLAKYAYSNNNKNYQNETTVKTLLADADKYINGTNSNYVPASITNNKDSEIYVSNTTTRNKVIGPFKITYTGTVTAKVNTGSYIRCDINGNKTSDQTIPNNTLFYIKPTANIENITFTAKSNNSSITSKIWILEGTNQNNKSTQRMIVCDHSKESTEESVTVNINTSGVGNLKVLKIDADTEANLDMGFVVQMRKDTTSPWYWVRVTGSDGNYTYNPNTIQDNYKYVDIAKNANGDIGPNFNNKPTKMGTKTSGAIIKGLPTGYEYRVIEFSAPKGYTLSNQEGYDNKRKWVNLTWHQGNNTYISLSKGKTKTVKYTNNPDTGSLKIVKKDADTGAKLNMGFFLQAMIENKWYWVHVKETNKSDVWEYNTNTTDYPFVVKDENNNVVDTTKTVAGTKAPRFHTSNNGTVTIIGLPVDYKYRVIEYEAPSAEYTLSYQKGYNSTREWVNLTDVQGEDDSKVITVVKAKTKTVTYTNKHDLTVNIIKEDEDTQQRLNMRFVMQVKVGNSWVWLRTSKESSGVYKYSTSTVSKENNNYKYIYDSTNDTFNNVAVDDGHKATNMYTANNGSAKITGIPGDYTEYRVLEISCNGYDIQKQKGTYHESLKMVNLTSSTGVFEKTESKNVITYSVTNTKPKGDLKVLKTDNTTNEYISMGFKVRVNMGNGGYKWLKETNDYDSSDNDDKILDMYSYVDNHNDATEYSLEDIEDLKEGYTIGNLETKYTYQIWESQPPSEDYKLEKQTGYDSETGMVNLTGTDNWITVEENKVTEVSYKNTKEPKQNMKITGYVWLDEKHNKENTTNNLRDENEKGVYDVKVYLYKKGYIEQLIAVGRTDRYGKYVIVLPNNIQKKDLKDYYIAFDYRAAVFGYRNYIPVAFDNPEMKNFNINGSRALLKGNISSNEIDDNSTENLGIATTFFNYKYSPIDYGLSRFATELYNEQANELQYINLGLKEIHEIDYEIVEDLKYVKVSVNGYSYIYQYGKELDSISTTMPTVKFGNKSTDTYSRSFYASDIYYNQSNGGDKLKVYVVYGIAIRNYDEYEQEDYREDYMEVTSLISKFDTNRYELSTDTSGTSEIESVKSDFANWEQTSDGEAKFKDSFQVGKTSTETKYIQFKVKNNALEELLSNPTGTIKESTPTSATSIASHHYYRTDSGWNGGGIPIFNKEQEHKSRPRTKKDNAPYLGIKLSERIIQGIVFEDGVTIEDKNLGDGIYQSNENTVSGATVELLDINQNKAYIYTLENPTGTEGITTSDEAGEFNILGVLPGKYYIKITYANGNTVIYDTHGNLLEDKEISVDKYKSTVVVSEGARNAIKQYYNQQYNAQIYNDGTWYRYMYNEQENDNYSVAVDNLNLRAKNNSGEVQNSMYAQTGMINITIENTANSYTTVGEGEKSVPLYTGFNLGIIEQQKPTVEIEKKITKLSLVNSPNVILEGNPEKDDVLGVSDLDGVTNNGSTFARMELESSLIYSSDLVVEYTIQVKNVSNINYYETDKEHYSWYYMFGITGSYSKEAQINIDEIIDCYDPLLKYNETEDSDISKITYNTTEGWKDNTGDRQKSITEQEKLTSTTDKQYKYKEVLAINNLGTIARNNEISKTITMSKTLSTQDEDLYFANAAGVDKLSNAVASEDKNKQQAKESLKLISTPICSNPAKAVLTISEPTGFDKGQFVIYAITGTVMLIVLATGIVIIKKKILK